MDFRRDEIFLLAHEANEQVLGGHHIVKKKTKSSSRWSARKQETRRGHNQKFRRKNFQGDWEDDNMHEIIVRV